MPKLARFEDEMPEGDENSEDEGGEASKDAESDIYSNEEMQE